MAPFAPQNSPAPRYRTRLKATAMLQTHVTGWGNLYLFVFYGQAVEAAMLAVIYHHMKKCEQLKSRKPVCVQQNLRQQNCGHW
jgi:hypothetical protein